MTVRRVVPIITVPDIEAARDAYVQTLGMREVMNHGWIITLADDRHQLSLLTADATAAVNPTVSIEVDDVDAAHAGRGGRRPAHRASAVRRGVGRPAFLLRGRGGQRRQRAPSPLSQRGDDLALEEFDARSVVGGLGEVEDRVLAPEIAHLGQLLDDLLGCPARRFG